MKNLFLVLDETDNVGTALSVLEPGSTLMIRSGGTEQMLTLTQTIPMGHKFALNALELGEAVKKYGATIGRCIQPIARGQHVHLHNIESQRGRGDK